MLPVTLTEESAASTSTLITALSAFVIIKKIVLLGLPPLLLETVSVMMGQIMLTATMMVEIVVDMMLTLVTVLIANAI
jgi:hypothetical protein